MKKYTNYIFLITIFSCLIIIMSVLTGLMNASDKATVYIKDISGDRSILDNVVISGLIQDRYHGLEFEIKNNEVNKYFRYYDHNNDMILEDTQSPYYYTDEGVKYLYQIDLGYFIPPGSKTSIKTEKGKEQTGSDYMLVTRNSDGLGLYAAVSEIILYDKFTQWNSIRMKSESELRSEIKEFEIWKKTITDAAGRNGYEQYGYNLSLPIPSHDVKRALAKLKEELYFTILTTPEYSGTNGIYKIEKFIDRMNPMINYNENEYGKVQTITSFSLDDQNIRVLGLEAVNDKLVLIVTKDNLLILQAYDPSNGSLIDELVITSVGDIVLSNYRFFEDGSKFNIGFLGIVEKDDMTLPRTLIFSGELDDSFKMLHLVENLDINNGYYLMNLDNIYEVDEKLFVFSYLNRKIDDQDQSYSFLRPNYYVMNVYGNGKLLYQGELVNDSDEDYIADRQKAKSMTNGYATNKYRQISGVRVRGR